MTNFEEACKMSAEKWVASFPDEVEAHAAGSQCAVPRWQGGQIHRGLGRTGL